MRKKYTNDYRCWVSLENGENEYFTDLEEAERYVIELTGKDININLSITCEVKIEEESENPDIILIDLPGFNNHVNHEDFISLKEKYLNKDESIIIHVGRADIDPSNEHSHNFLHDVKGKIIRILTHIDFI